MHVVQTNQSSHPTQPGTVNASGAFQGPYRRVAVLLATLLIRGYRKMNASGPVA